MAVFETWLKSDLKMPLTVKQLSGNLFSADRGGNLIGVEVTDNGEPAELSGVVTGYFIRPDNGTIIISGELNGNKASVILPESAYVVVGVASLVIKVGTTTVGACTSRVYRSSTDKIIDPGHVIPSLEELLEKIADCEEATDNANTAAATANEKALLADTKASFANEKALLANEKAALANEKANLADTAAASANAGAQFATEKANLANTKAELAELNAGLANDAADLANEKAMLADRNAVAANNAASAANTAASKVTNMTVSASGLAPSQDPTVVISEVSGHKHIAFGIPKGEKGNPGTDFRIRRTFSSIAAMQAYDPDEDQSIYKVLEYDHVMIDTGDVSDVDTGKLYCYEPQTQEVWRYIGDLSGAQGIKGETGTGISSVVLNNDYTLTIHFTDGTSTTTGSVRGPKGETGDTGNGISGASLNPDYTLTLRFTDGSSVTTGSIRGATGETGAKGETGDTGATGPKGETGDTGNGIASIMYSSSAHTLTITMTDGREFTTGNIQGEIGITPNLTIGTVTTIEPNQQAYVQITGTDENPVLNFGIPRGQTGSVSSIYGTNIPVSENDSRSIKAVLDTKLESVYGTTVPVSESDSRSVKAVLDTKLETVYGTTVPVSESDSRSVKAVLDTKLETVPVMTGATSQAAGAAGLAPAPAIGDEQKFLRGDASYANPGVVTINGRSPDPVTGDIVVIEGGGSGSYGSYRLDATIPVSSWSNSSPYTATVANSLIKSTMDGAETWLDDPTAMLGETTFTTLDGSMTVSTTVKPVASWGLHVALALNGADVLAEMDNNTRAIGKIIPIITGTTNNTGSTIASGEYFEANGNLYKATSAIPADSAWSSSASQLSGTALNDAFSTLSSAKVNTSDIVDALNSTETQKPLSAAQGKALNDSITSLSSNLYTWNLWKTFTLNSSGEGNIDFPTNAKEYAIRIDNYLEMLVISTSLLTFPQGWISVGVYAGSSVTGQHSANNLAPIAFRNGTAIAMAGKTLYVYYR